MATSSHHTEEEITLPGPEESTAIEMRQDFTAYVTRILSVAMNQCEFTISFPVKAVTIRSKVGEGSGQDGIENSLTTVVEHRAVLIVDLSSSLIVQPTCTEISPEARVWTEWRPKVLCQSRSDLSAPIDELVDEELTKACSRNGHLRQIETRSVSFKDTSMDETLATTAPSTPQSICEVDVGSTPASPQQEKVATAPYYVTLADQIKATSVDSSTESAPSTSWQRPTSFGTNTSTAISTRSQHSPPMLDDDYNAPHDELNASMDTGVLSNRSAPLVEECPVAKKKRKPKPVFELPEKLFLEDSLSRGLAALTKPPDIGENLLNDLSLPAPITIVRTGTYDNTVTSALTGPFYIDDQGNLRDVFEHSPEGDRNGDDDDDTRAQARRHEWIQTALLNRGIGERMETLLKQEATEDPTPALTSMDSWEWLTGLDVCEFSRALLKSVEEYVSGIGGDLRRDPEAMPATDLFATTEKVVAAESGATVEPTAHNLTSSSLFAKSRVVLFADVHEGVRNSSTIVSDSAHIVQAQLHSDGQNQEDLSHLADCNIELVDQNDSREESNGSQSSTDSPRGVHTFDDLPMDVTKQRQEQFHSIHIASYSPTDGASADTRQPTTLTNAEVVPKRKNRGITAMFRRRKENL
jgi:hypothetical protein